MGSAFRIFSFVAVLFASLGFAYSAEAKVVKETYYEWHSYLPRIVNKDPVELCKSIDRNTIGHLYYDGVHSYESFEDIKSGISFGQVAGATVGGKCKDAYGHEEPLGRDCKVIFEDGTHTYKSPAGRNGISACGQPRTCVPKDGNPVDVSNHSLVEAADDWVSGKDSRFRLRRIYRSDQQLIFSEVHRKFTNNNWFAGVWRQEYSDSIVEKLSNLSGRNYYTSVGAKIEFDGTSSGSASQNWHPYDISVANGHYIITDGSGKTLHIKKLNDHYNGLLDEIEWTDGYHIYFERLPRVNSSDERRWQIVVIRDNRGQRAELTWSKTATPNSTVWVVSKVDIDTDYDGTTFAPEVTISYSYAENSLDSKRIKLATVTRTDIGSGISEEIWSYSYLQGQTETDAFLPPALTSIQDGRTDSNGAAFDYANFSYQADGAIFGKVIQSGHSGGAETYTFDPETSVVTNSLGRQTTYSMTTIEGIERVLSVEGAATTSCLGTSVNYNYTPGANEPEGFVYERTERNGSKTRYTRDSKGRVLTKTEDADGTSPRVTSYTWYGDFRLPLTRTTSQMSETFTYSPDGLLTQYTQTDILAGSPSNGQTRTWDYWYSTLPSGLKVLTLLDGPGLTSDGVVDETTYTYDSDGNLLTTTDANGLVTTVVSMNAASQPTQINNPDGTKWIFTYDIQGRVTSSGFGNQAISPPTNSYTYDAVGQLISLTNTRGKTWTFEYNKARRLVSTISPAGDVVSYSYDAAGNITRTEYSDGTTAATFWEETQFDELSRLLKTVGANGQTWDFSHDVEDNLTTIADPTSLQTSQNFDALNRLADTVDRAGFTNSKEYNDTDQITRFTDPRLIETNTAYNGFGEVVSEVSADRGTIQYSYNNRGLVTSMTDARGITVNYLYDNVGRLTKIDYPPGTKSDISLYYNNIQGHKNAGKLILTWDGSVRRAMSHSVYYNGPQTTYQHRYPGNQRYNVYEAFDFEGNRKWLQYPKSNDRVYYDYDDDDRVTRIRMKQGSTYTTIIDNITYLPNGPVSSMDYGDGFTQTRTYDTSYRLTGITDSNGTTTLRDIDMGYTTRDNLASVTDQLDALRNENFTYSTRELLASANGAYGDLTYTYDGVTNRTSRTTVTPTDSYTHTYSYPADSNRLASDTVGAGIRTFTYDAAGNVTYDNRARQGYGYTYDAANRMESFSINGVVQAEYKYNYLGQQVIRTLTQDGRVINSVYGPDGNRMAEFEYDPLAGSSTLLREYVWFEGKPIAVIEGGVVYYVRSDHIGRPVFATDSTGTKVWEATYLPFGGVHTSSGNSIDLRFPGQWFQSESGLHQNWMRDYDPTTGRYIEADPLGLINGASVYGYVGQNPNRYIDPRGEQSISIGGGASYPPGGFGSSGSADIGGAWDELLVFSHNYNPIDLFFQYCFKETERPNNPPYNGANKCTLMYSNDVPGKDMECNYACEGPPPYWNVVHIPSGAQCKITHWD